MFLQQHKTAAAAQWSYPEKPDCEETRTQEEEGEEDEEGNDGARVSGTLRGKEKQEEVE